MQLRMQLRMQLLAARSCSLHAAAHATTHFMHRSVDATAHFIQSLTGSNCSLHASGGLHEDDRYPWRTVYELREDCMDARSWSC